MTGPLFAVAISFAVGGLLVLALGRNPFEVYGALLTGAFSGWPNLSVTLQMMTPLLFTGLAVSIAFRSGMWNIGVEGQMLMGALLAGIVGYAAPLPDVLMIPACVLAALIGGAAWAAIPALLRVFVGVNELVLCLMLNPIALSADRLYFGARSEGAGPHQQAARRRGRGAPDQFHAVLAAQYGNLHRARLLRARGHLQCQRPCAVSNGS